MIVRTANFKAFGPFHLVSGDGALESKELKAFWKQTDEGLAGAIGVYVLLAKGSEDLRPIYVGKAERGFASRLKANHDSFRKGRLKYRDDSLSLLFLARVATKKETFVRKRKGSEKLGSILALETLLIRDFTDRGYELLNIHGKTLFEKLHVPGYIHSGETKLDDAAKTLKGLLRVKKVARS